MEEDTSWWTWKEKLLNSLPYLMVLAFMAVFLYEFVTKYGG